MTDAGGTHCRKNERRTQQRQHDDLFCQARAGHPTRNGCETNHQHVGSDAHRAEAKGNSAIAAIQ